MSCHCCNCRKRKTPEPCVQPRIIRMVWDVDADSKNAIMKDMGVSLLAADEKSTVRGSISNTASSCCASQSVQSHVSNRVVSIMEYWTL